MAAMEAAQNTDGGWPYEQGRSSWTEPSVFALLAGLNGGMAPSAIRRGVDWLKSSQNADGGWPSQPKTGPSTWVTALVALLPASLLGDSYHQACMKWLLLQTGQESNILYRIRQWMLGNQKLSTGSEPGWAWYPGAAAWVMPTALSLVALRHEQKSNASADVARRIQGGVEYLLAHACKDGGWNHGATHALGYEAGAYPETTGVALLALRGEKAPEIDRGIAIAERFFQQPNPAGAAWLRIGLLAQGCPAPVLAPPVHPRRVNVVDQALYRLSEEPDVLFS